MEKTQKKQKVIEKWDKYEYLTMLKSKNTPSYLILTPKKDLKGEGTRRPVRKLEFVLCCPVEKKQRASPFRLDFPPIPLLPPKAKKTN